MEIAIAVNKIKRDQLLFDIRNQCSKHNIVVYSNKEMFLNKSFGFSILTYYDMWYSNADYHIATCLYSAKSMLLNPKIKIVYFYVWDLEWVYGVHEYEDIKNIYTNKRIELVARSEDHSKSIYDSWNIKARIAYNFDLDNIVGKKHEKVNI